MSANDENHTPGQLQFDENGNTIDIVIAGIRLSALRGSIEALDAVLADLSADLTLSLRSQAAVSSHALAMVETIPGALFELETRSEALWEALGLESNIEEDDDDELATSV